MSRQQVVTAELANGAVTTAKILDATIATADLANSAVTNAKLASDTARANLLTNGGFEIWQRGNGPFTTNFAYSADRWVQPIYAADVLSLNRNTAQVDVGSTACAAAVITVNGGGGNSGLMQKVYLASSDGGQLVNRTVAASVRVWANVANGVRICLAGDGTPAGGVASPYHPGDSTYRTLTVTTTITSSPMYLAINFGVTGTYYLDNAMLVVGSVAADYAPLHPADDLARCLRYYETVGKGSSFLFAAWAGAASEALGSGVRWQVPKVVVPTVTKIGTWAVGNCGQPVVAAASVDGAQVYALSNGVGHVQYPSGVSEYFVAEANP